MLKDYPLHNCENCLSTYMEYENKPYSSEYWCELSLKKNGKLITPIGLCQFCNPKTPYYRSHKDDGYL